MVALTENVKNNNLFDFYFEKIRCRRGEALISPCTRPTAIANECIILGVNCGPIALIFHEKKEGSIVKRQNVKN